MLTLGLLIASPEVMDKVIVLPTLALAVFFELLERMVTLESVGAIVSMVNELTVRLSLVLLLLVTVIVQLYVPSARALKAIVLLPADALEVELVQPPP